MEYTGIYLPVEILFEVVSYNPSPSLALVDKKMNAEVTRVYNASVNYLLEKIPNLAERVVRIDRSSTSSMRYFLHLMEELHGFARHLGCDVSVPGTPSLEEKLEWDYAHFKTLVEKVQVCAEQTIKEDFKKFVSTVADAAGFPVVEGFDPQEVWKVLVDSPAVAALEELNLNRKDLKFLPSEIGRLTNIKKLYLDGNQLRTLPDSIQALTRLERFYLNNNKLEWIPDSIALPQLQYFELRSNQLQEIPNLANYPRLRIVYMHKNQVREIPATLHEPETLQRVYLNNNPLRTIPDPISAKINL